MVVSQHEELYNTALRSYQEESPSVGIRLFVLCSQQIWPQTHLVLPFGHSMRNNHVKTSEDMFLQSEVHGFRSSMCELWIRFFISLLPILRHDDLLMIFRGISFNLNEAVPCGRLIPDLKEMFCVCLGKLLCDYWEMHCGCNFACSCAHYSG